MPLHNLRFDIWEKDSGDIEFTQVKPFHGKLLVPLLVWVVSAIRSLQVAETDPFRPFYDYAGEVKTKLEEMIGKPIELQQIKTRFVGTTSDSDS